MRGGSCTGAALLYFSEREALRAGQLCRGKISRDLDLLTPGIMVLVAPSYSLTVPEPTNLPTHLPPFDRWGH